MCVDRIIRKLDKMHQKLTAHAEASVEACHEAKALAAKHDAEAVRAYKVADNIGALLGK